MLTHKKVFEPNLEILRGMASFIVVFHHLFVLKIFSVNYNPPGHLSVLIFFILSGYVIGISTPPLESQNAIIDYIKKRSLRLFPIYIISILFTFLITLGKYDLFTIVSNFLLISVPLDNVIHENGPLWSLHFELLFYFIFILISFYKLSPKKILLLLLLTILIFFALGNSVNKLIISYFIGFTFWISGVWLANSKNISDKRYYDSELIGIFILLFALEKLSPFKLILSLMKIPLTIDTTSHSWYYYPLPYEDLLYLPICIVLICRVTQKYFLGQRILNLLVFALPLIAFINLIRIGKLHIFHETTDLICTFALFLGIGLSLFKFNIIDSLKTQMKKLKVLGSISYGIYIIHFPLLILFSMLNWGDVYWSKLFAYLITVIAAGFILEKLIQPKIKQLIYKPTKIVPINN
jgi:peptidoglycan/LPS O-acetylase OafA/YrhL